MKDPYITPSTIGRSHCNAIEWLKEGKVCLSGAPSSLFTLLSTSEGGRPNWTYFVVPSTGREIRHTSVLDWITRQPTEGLGVTLKFVVDVLTNAEDPKLGGATLAMLDQQLRAEGYDGINAAIAGQKIAKVPAALTASEAGKLGGRGKKKAEKAVDHINSFGGGTSADYIAARIKRDHPDIAARVEAGEFKSMRAAGIVAGVVKAPPSDVEKARKALDKLSDDDARYR